MRKKLFSCKADIAISLLLAILLSVSLFFSSAEGQGNTEGSISLEKVAMIWFKGVISENKSVLLEYALPEDRPHVLKSLSLPDSAISKELFYSPTSLKMKLAGIKEKDVGLRLFKHESLKEHGEGTDVCFYDTRAPVQNWL